MSEGQLDNEKELERAKQLAKDAQLEHENDLRAVMATPEGRRLIWSLVDDDQLSFDIDPYRTAFREGRRSVRLTLKGECMHAATSDFLLMTKERLERIEKRATLEKEASKAE